MSVNLKAGHYQGEVLAKLLQAPVKSEELMCKLEEFGILQRRICLEQELYGLWLTWGRSLR